MLPCRIGIGNDRLIDHVPCLGLACEVNLEVLLLLNISVPPVGNAHPLEMVEPCLRVFYMARMILFTTEKSDLMMGHWGVSVLRNWLEVTGGLGRTPREKLPEFACE